MKRDSHGVFLGFLYSGASALGGNAMPERAPLRKYSSTGALLRIIARRA